MKKAVIVAAGLSSRLSLSNNLPKGLLKIGGQSLLERSINALRDYGIQKIGIVVGFKAALLKRELNEKIIYINNPFYRHSNNLASLWFAKNFVGEDPFIYLHGDLIYDPEILKNAINDFSMSNSEAAMVTDYSKVDEEAMKVLVDKNMLKYSHKDIPLSKANGEWTGIALFKEKTKIFSYAENILLEEGLDFYDTYCFSKMANNGISIHCSSTRGLTWEEIDFQEDYSKAKELFS